MGCAAAIASLEVFETEPVFDRIRMIERIHRERLPLLTGHELVGDLRTVGTVAAIELETEDSGYLSEIRPKLYQYFLDHGVLLRPLGNVIYILPPYVIGPEELHHVYDVVGEAIVSISH